MKSYISIFAISLFAFTANTSLAEDKVVATVNNVKITSTDLDNHIKMLNTVTRQKVNDRNKALQDLVKREILYQEAVKKKIHERKELNYILAFQQRELYTSTLLSESEAAKNITDEDLKKLYNEKIKNVNIREFKVRHVLFKKDDANSEKNAKTVIAELDAGKNFEELAKSKSQGPSGPKGGDIGWLNEAQLRNMPDLAQALSEMKKGSYSKKPVKSNIGWHVLKLDDIRKKEPPTFEQTKKQLRTVVQQQNIRKYVQKLQDKAKVEIKLK